MDTMPAQSGLPDWWCVVDNPHPKCDAIHDRLAPELETELHPEHPLHGVPLWPIAHDVAYDDVIFQYVDDPARFVEVHLTWSGHSEAEGCPSIECAGSWSDILGFQETVMAAIKQAHELEAEGLRVPMGPAGTPSKPILVKPMTLADLSGDPVLSEIDTPYLRSADPPRNVEF